MITSLDNSGIRVVGSLRKTTAGVVHVTVPVPLAAQTPVSLRLWEDYQTDGEITACEKRDGFYFVDVRVHELRREPRFAVNDPAQVLVLNVGNYPNLQGRVSDLSKSGLAIMIDSAIPVGCSVKVELADGVVLGEVRYCVKVGSEFRAGVATESVLFRDHPTEKPPAAPARPLDSLWSSLNKLDEAVKSY